MKSDFENMHYSDNDRLAMLETRAAEIERLLGSVPPERDPTGAANGPDYPAATVGYPASGGYQQSGGYPPPGEYPGVFEYLGSGDDDDPDDRTEVLVNRGRRNARPKRFAFVRSHWKSLSAVAGAFAILGVVLAAIGPGTSASWPASVATMQSQITVACENPNVAAEPSQLNFACGKDTRQILWIFALLTSGGNPGYVDPSTGRKGLEPITPAQGGDVAWSLNLHAPYNPVNAVDSLEVAARAINNIISGATLTNSSGTPSVQAGLESSAANCQQYTGSSALTTRPGYPAACAHAVSSDNGQQALVTDVFRQWMVGVPAQLATDAGVLFVNSANPGDPRVRQILETLPGSGL